MQVFMVNILFKLDASFSLQLIWLVTHALAGNLDGAVIRYILVMTDFIKKIDWMTVNDFKNFAAVIYPSLTVRILKVVVNL